MHDPRDLVLVQRAAECGEVGDVAPHQGQPSALVRGEDQLEAVGRVPEVVADRLVAVVEHRFHRPGADAPERSRDQHALAQ